MTFMAVEANEILKEKEKYHLLHKNCSLQNKCLLTKNISVRNVASLIH